jgi:hypothetical protein
VSPSRGPSAYTLGARFAAPFSNVHAVSQPCSFACAVFGIASRPNEHVGVPCARLLQEPCSKSRSGWRIACSRRFQAKLYMTTQAISVLLIGDHCGDIDRLRLLHHTRWCVWRANSAAEARATLKRVPVQVLLCQHTLHDGTWLDLLNAAEECDPPAAMVVVAKPDDRTWAEVLSNGAYELLPLPCSAPELYALVPMAWRHCMQGEVYHHSSRPKHCCNESQHE